MEPLAKGITGIDTGKEGDEGLKKPNEAWSFLA